MAKTLSMNDGSFTTDQRELNSKERKHLLARVRFSVNDDLGGPLTFLFVFAVVAFGVGKLLTLVVSEGYANLVAAVGFAVIWLTTTAKQLRRMVSHKRGLRRDLELGVASVVRVRNATVVQQGAEETSTPQFYFVAAGRCLFLSGQDLFGARGFPSKDLDVVRAPESGIILSRESKSEKVRPERQLKNSEIDTADFGEFQVFDVMDPRLSALPKSLRP